LEKYFEEHTDERASKGVARSAGGILLSRLGRNIRISELVEARQRKFVKGLLADGYKLSYAARIMTVLAAALRHAEILQPGIIYTESRMKARWHLSSTEPKRPTFRRTRSARGCSIRACLLALLDLWS
jgi:hypothetical protein